MLCATSLVSTGGKTSLAAGNSSEVTYILFVYRHILDEVSIELKFYLCHNDND